jgi:hypothetical protein
MVLLGGRAGSLIIRRMGQLFIHNGISHLDIRFEKLAPRPGVAQLAFSKKSERSGLSSPKKIRFRVLPSLVPQHTHHHMKKLPSPSSRDVWEIFSLSSAQSPFSLVDR